MSSFRRIRGNETEPRIKDYSTYGNVAETHATIINPDSNVYDSHSGELRYWGTPPIFKDVVTTTGTDTPLTVSGLDHVSGDLLFAVIVRERNAGSVGSVVPVESTLGDAWNRIWNTANGRIRTTAFYTEVSGTGDYTWSDLQYRENQMWLIPVMKEYNGCLPLRLYLIINLKI